MADIVVERDREKQEEALARSLGLERHLYQQAIEAAANFVTASPAPAADSRPRPWRQWGARNVAGRVRAFAQNPQDPSVLYAGSAQGGVFRSTDGGDTWQPIGLPQDSFPVGALAISPSNPNILYVGTGEPGSLHDTPFPAPPASPDTLQGREALAAGRGFFSYDAGSNRFTKEAGPALSFPAQPGSANSYAAIVVDPQTPGRCWIASHTGLWRRNPQAPQFVAEALPSPANAAAPKLGACISDVVLSLSSEPGKPPTYRLLAAAAGIGIFRGSFQTDSANSSWESRLEKGLPDPGQQGTFPFDRICLAVCESAPDHVYAVFESAADHSIFKVFHSSDGGSSWNTCAIPAGLGNQGWNNLCIAVHPENPSIVVVGNVDLARSLDFGATWEKISDSQNFPFIDRAQHGGQNALLFDVQDRSRLWIANDGGIASTRNVIGGNPMTDRSWRVRSNGLCVSQFNDVTAHPSYPFMLGGGIQNEGSYVSIGGPTWLPVGDADGGQITFELRDPRKFVTSHQGSAANPGNLMQSSIVAGTTVAPAPQQYPRIVRASLADLATPSNGFFAASISAPTVPAGLGGLFLQNLIHHPAEANQLLAGRTGDAVFSTDGGATYTAAGSAAQAGASDICAVAYGPGATAAESDWWLGTTSHLVLLGAGGAVPKQWSTVTPPSPDLANAVITRIAIHPRNANYVVAASGSSQGGNAQGRVFLSNNRGKNWMDITGAATATVLGGAAGAVAGTPSPLPPGPITSLVFDPSPADGDAQALFVGTMAGVCVIRNLPALPAAAADIPPPAAFNPTWLTFNGSGNGSLPLTLVNDLEIVVMPARPGAAASSPESSQRVRLYAAMLGRGIFACDISPSYPAGVADGGPARRLFLRQHSIEDGLAYPRPSPSIMNTAPAAPGYNNPQVQGDPRVLPVTLPLPSPAPTGAFSNFSAMDIRVVPHTLARAEGAIDGVEFDEELRGGALRPGLKNSIYVQVHTAGWDRFTQPVDVHLFFAKGFAPAGDDPAPLPDLHDNFWANFTVEPLLPAPGAPPASPAAQWQRTGRKRTIPASRLSAGNPAVVRFEWSPPASLANGFTALLAVCTAAEDPLPDPSSLPRALATLLQQERRAAFCLVPTEALTPHVFVRDGIDDQGEPGSTSSAGRSPDIIIVETPVANPSQTFTDLADSRHGDVIRLGVDQHIYVRVHNSQSSEIQAKVDVFWVKPNTATFAPDANTPAFDGSKWQPVAPVGSATITIPANGWNIASLTWRKEDIPIADAGTAFHAIGFAAIVSSPAGDAAPDKAHVFDPASFWQFFGTMADSNNAAFRVLRYEFFFDPPGAVGDLGAPGSDVHRKYNDWLSANFKEVIDAVETTVGVGRSQLYHPKLTATTTPTASLTITWKGFPMRYLRPIDPTLGSRDSRTKAWQAADVFTLGVAREQDEYLEWHVTKNGDGKIQKIDFTAEAHDYWRSFLALKAPAKVLELYQTFISPAVTMADLFPGGGPYDMLNKWNTSDGAMHLTEGANALSAEIKLVGDATILVGSGATRITDPLQLVDCRGYGERSRASDPRIGWDINNLAQLGLAITLQNPVGLLIDGLDDTGFLKPNGDPVGNYWKVLRGFSGGAVRATYEVPASEGFVVGDITIGGRKIEFGGQVAENVTMKVVGLACRPNSFPGEATVGCTPVDPTLPIPVFGSAPAPPRDIVLADGSLFPSRSNIA